MLSNFSNLNIQQNTTPSMQLIARSEITEITNYLDQTLSCLEPLDYEIEYTFDPKALSEVLGEDLPDVESKNYKNTFISDRVQQCQLFYDLS